VRVLGVSFDEITLDFIEQLVSDAVVESRTHEYRGILPNDLGAKSRFVTTASAFANTVGGVFMFGVGESQHRPTAAHGIEGLDYDESKRRLEQLLRTSTDPPLTRVSSRLLTKPAGAPVLLYGIAPGVGGPCAVLSQQGQANAARVYYRRGDGLNHVMTTAELRDAFLAFDQWSRDVEEFRHERLQFYTALEISPHRPSNLIGRGGFLALHVLPLGRLNERRNLLGTTPAVGNVFGASIPGVRTNVDGVGITFHGHPRAFVQCFRNGGVECI
jgi:Putative DNA-binding domain